MLTDTDAPQNYTGYIINHLSSMESLTLNLKAEKTCGQDNMLKSIHRMFHCSSSQICSLFVKFIIIMSVQFANKHLVLHTHSAVECTKYVPNKCRNITRNELHRGKAECKKWIPDWNLRGKLTKTPVTPEMRPYSVPTAFKKMQNAEMRAVQTPATLWKRCAIA